MERKEILEAIKFVKQNSKKRKFSESLELIINLKGLNLKKENEKILNFVTLPHERQKKVRIVALVGQELSTKAKAVCDSIILLEDFKKQEKKTIRKLAKKTDFFIAQANIMPKVAATFGRILGPRGLMPNPKAGCILPPTAEVKPLAEKLKTLIKIETKNEQTIKASIGLSTIDDEKLADNALAIYSSTLASAPQEKNNIKNIILKSTMGKPFVVGQKQKPIQEEPKQEVKLGEPKQKAPVEEKKKAPKEEPAKKEAKPKEKPAAKPKKTTAKTKKTTKGVAKK